MLDAYFKPPYKSNMLSIVSLIGIKSKEKQVCIPRLRNILIEKAGMKTYG